MNENTTSKCATRLMKAIIFMLFIMFLAPSSGLGQTEHCIADRYSQTALFDSAAIEIDTGVLYAIAERWPSDIIDSLRMDVYRPSETVDDLEARPMILMMHGGAWLAGNRNDMAYECMEMARRGFVTATISYRLGWDCPATDVLTICALCSSQASKLKNALYRAVQDERAALRFLTAHAEEYGIDTEYIFVQGESAGSLTVLHSTFWDQSEADLFCPWCLDDMGSLDDSGNELTEIYEIRGVVNNCGGLNSLDAMDGQNIPVIGFHDEWDCIVPYGAANVLNCFGCSSFFYTYGSDAIRARLTSNDVCQQMNRKLASLNHCSYPTNAIIGKSACFIKSILCQDCSSTINTDLWNIPDCSAGIEPNSLAENRQGFIEVFPNPGHSELNILIPSNLKLPLILEVNGMDGRLEYREVILSHNSLLKLDRFTQGMKVLRLYREDGSLELHRMFLVAD